MRHLAELSGCVERWSEFDDGGLKWDSGEWKDAVKDCPGQGQQEEEEGVDSVDVDMDVEVGEVGWLLGVLDR